MDRYEGFRDFVVARGGALSRSAYLLTGDHQLAEDLLQTALARTAVHWSRIADGDPDAYVRRAMVNLRTSWWRRHRYAVELPTAELPVVPVPDGAETVVRRMAVAAALAQLSPRQRAMLVLRFFDDLTEAQTAEALGCSVGTLNSCRHPYYYDGTESAATPPLASAMSCSRRPTSWSCSRPQSFRHAP